MWKEDILRAGKNLCLPTVGNLCVRARHRKSFFLAVYVRKKKRVKFDCFWCFTTCKFLAVIDAFMIGERV